MLPGYSTGIHLLQWAVSQVIQEVPEDHALCEFDCRRLECSHDDWITCERRLKRAEGELLPLNSTRTSEKSSRHSEPEILEAAER